MRSNLLATDIPLPATRMWQGVGGPGWRGLDEVGRRWHAACRPILWRRWESRGEDDDGRIRNRSGLIVAARTADELRAYVREVAEEEAHGGFRACAVPVMEEVDGELRWSTLREFVGALGRTWWPGRWHLTWHYGEDGPIRVRDRHGVCHVGTLRATFPTT